MNRWQSRLLLYGLLTVLLAGFLAAGLGPLPRIALHSLFGIFGDRATSRSVRELLQPAPGYQVSLFAAGIPNVRWLLFTPDGDLLASSPNTGRIFRLRDDDGDGSADSNDLLIENLNLPHGLAILDQWLYIAETNAVGRLPYPSFEGARPGAYERIVSAIPGGGNHWRRVIAIGPDRRLYLAIGSSCNVCIEEQPLRATIVRYNADGSDPVVIATGLRNATGFDWAPWNQELYATENARDWLGDDFPPDELNLIHEGGFYGWPYINGDNVPDPDLGGQADERVDDARRPVFHFRPHNAPLGITFLRHQPSDRNLDRSALVALHGSWNRSKPDGYKVVALHWDQDGNIRTTDFLTGFLQDERVVGRPVAIAEAPDGSIYVSDDFADAIYRLIAVD